MKNRWNKSALALSLKLLTKKEKRRILIVSSLQVFMGLLDLLAIGLIGILGSLAVTGVSSRNPGNRVGDVLEFLGLRDQSLQFQTGILGVSAAVLLVCRTLLSMYFSRKILYFLSLRAAVISRQMLERILNQSLFFVQGRTSQQTLFALTNGVSAITVGIIGLSINVFADISLMVVMLLGLFVLDPIISTSMLIGFALIGFLLYQLMHKRAGILGAQTSVLEIESSENIFAVISTYREAFVKNRREFYVDRIGGLRFKLSNTQAELAFMPYISKYVIESVVVLGSLVLCAIQFSVQDAAHAVATLAIFLTAATRIAPAALRVQQASLQLKSNMGSAAPTLQLIEELSKSESNSINKYVNAMPDTDFEAAVTLSNVVVRYQGASQPAISDISLVIQPGELLAITGPSGSGKSTLVDALLGVIPIQSGSVTVSNVSPQSAISKWPGKIGYVPQNVILVPGSVLENVALGFEKVDVSIEAVWKALEIAKLSDYVKNLPEQLETRIGEGAIGLSGGQRQRLGIARAMYSSPELLVLDEATSALDSSTEKSVSESIEALHGSVTTIVIAHRLSTVMSADRIVLLENGKISAVGTFNELKSSNQEFSKLAQANGL
jgi:ATP-binding cassette, subfamily B, bacterial PglK